MRREEQLQAQLAELEQRLQHTAGSGSPDSAAAGDADDAEAVADAGGSSELRGASSRRRPPKDQPVTLAAVQNQVRSKTPNTAGMSGWLCWPGLAAPGKAYP